MEFRTEEDADYSIKIMHMVKLYGKPIKVNKASQDKKTQDIGANLFIGNLHDEVDEKMLREVFSAFGVVISTKVKIWTNKGSIRFRETRSQERLNITDLLATTILKVPTTPYIQ